MTDGLVTTFKNTILLFFVAAVSLAPSLALAQPVLPRVVSMEVPAYPSLARQAHVEGVVHIKITTDGHRVTRTQVEDGDKLLTKFAEDNVKTWEFQPHAPTMFTVTFRYKLTGGQDADASNPIITLRLPSEVELSCVPLELN